MSKHSLGANSAQKARARLVHLKGNDRKVVLRSCLSCSSSACCCACIRLSESLGATCSVSAPLGYVPALCFSLVLPIPFLCVTLHTLCQVRALETELHYSALNAGDVFLLDAWS